MTRTQRIAELRRRVRAGTYKVDPEAVAEAMLSRAHDATPRQTSEEARWKVRALDYAGVSQVDIARTTGLSAMTVYRILSQHFRPAVHFERRAA